MVGGIGVDIDVRQRHSREQKSSELTSAVFGIHSDQESVGKLQF